MRVHRPDAEPAQRLLALQRAAGNRAVSLMLQRSPEGTTTADSTKAQAPAPWQSWMSWSRFWGGPDLRAKPPPAAAIHILDAVMHGRTPPVEELGGREDPGVMQTLITILAHDTLVLYWRNAGCVEVDGENLHVRQPAPTEAVAGWLGLAPPLPNYLPFVPPQYGPAVRSGVAASSPTPPGGEKWRVPPAARDDAGLRTPEAFMVAVYILQQKIERQPYLARGILDRKYQVLALKILALICGRLAEVTYAIRLGMLIEHPNGTTAWERPPPASAIASRLGIGPDAQPGPLWG